MIFQSESVPIYAKNPIFYEYISSEFRGNQVRVL